MNETLKVIAERYSCRDYLPTPIPECDLRAIAEAAVQAPSGMNRQPWRVIVVTDRTLIGDIEAEGMALLAAQDDKTSYNRIMERGGRLFYGAPCMIMVASQPQTDMDCGILCENIALAATSLGIANVICGFTYLAFTGSKGEEFKRRLGFPEGYEFGCSVLLGYAKTARAPHTPDLGKISYIS